jgi:hypothetical protein
MDVDQVHNRLVSAGEEWADQDAAASLLEETRKTVLAELMNGLQGSIASRESEALANPVYKLHVTNMVTARKAANRAKVKYDSARAWCELVRTQEATRRAEITMR